VGFAILTASVSSIVLLYPALARTRLLAHGVAHLVAAERRSGVLVEQLDAAAILADLARDVTRARIDLVHFPIVYYFAARNPEASLASWTGALCRFAAGGQSADRPRDVRLAACVLDESLDEFAAILARRFLRSGASARDEVFRQYATAQLVNR
jgi:hypothetical protein